MTPEGWGRVPVSGLVASVGVGVSVKGHSRPAGTGEVGVLRISSVTYGTFRPGENKVVVDEDLSRVKESPRAGCVLVSRANTQELVGASAYVAEDHPGLVLPDKLWQLVPAPAIADGRWLQLVLSTPQMRGRISEAATGTSGSMKNIGREQFLALDVLVPPLPEQRKIAAILSSVDDAIAASQAVIDQIQVVKKALMAELLTKGLPGRHHRFKQTEIGEVPEAWDIRPLGDVASVERGRFSHRPRNDPRFFGGDTPFVQTGDVAASGGRLRRFSQTLNDAGLAVSRLFPAGTIVLTIAANIGDTGIAAFPVAFPDSLVGIQAGQSVDNRFLELVLRTRKKELDDAAPQNAQKNINLEILRPVLIQVPPLSEQVEIADAVEAIDDRLSSEKDALSALRATKSALMSVLLTGELRVRVDEEVAA